MKIVIVGGGFGGVKTALELANTKGIDVTLVSDKDHFLFYPALYSTATGRSRQQSIIPLEDFFSDTNVKVVEDTIIGVDTHRKTVTGKRGDYSFDRVVFALGVVTSYFGISGLDKYSYSIKSAHEVSRFKKHLHDFLVNDKHVDKNYIVVGAGPTGVELSASLASYLKHIADVHGVKRARIRLSLVEAAPRVLPRMSEAASELVEKRLKQLGVKVMTNKKVESEDDDSIVISGKDIPSHTVVWTSGVANHPFFAEHSDLFELAPNGRVLVDEHLKVGKYFYIVGDNANTPHTGLAQTAVGDALFAARAIKAEASHKSLRRYKSRKPPVVIPVGHNWAILEYGSLRLTGWVGSAIRRAADFIAYLDLFPLGRAWKLWISEDRSEEDCVICSGR